MFTIQRQSGGPTESYATGNHYMIPDFYTINVQNIDGYTFQGFTYNGVPMGRPANIQVALDGQLVANYAPVSTPTPTPQPTLTSYVSSVTGYSEATNPNNLIGSAPDGQYAGIVGMAPPYWPPYGSSGWIAGALNQPATGHIYLYAYGQMSGPLRVYTSTDGSNWVLRASIGVGSTPQWIDCGNVANQFSYIKLSTDPVGLYGVSIDCVGVQ
ncbi:MAG: hypothetical protein NWE96_04635 [Candidatus Bathyarchaeota archaeon]|nr:hypothetical protein [Candidatus Bathyarchaeota archaeon]